MGLKDMLKRLSQSDGAADLRGSNDDSEDRDDSANDADDDSSDD